MFKAFKSNTNWTNSFNLTQIAQKDLRFMLKGSRFMVDSEYKTLMVHGSWIRVHD